MSLGWASDWYPYQKRRRDIHQDKAIVRCTGKMPGGMYGEHGMPRNAEECRGGLAVPAAERKAWDTRSLSRQGEHGPANTSIWDF